MISRRLEEFKSGSSSSGFLIWAFFSPDCTSLGSGFFVDFRKGVERMGRWYYGKLKPKVKSCKRWRREERSYLQFQESQAQNHPKDNHLKTKIPTERFHYTLLPPPRAALNTTSYIIKAKEEHGIDDLPVLPVFDSYGSMKGMLKLESSREESGGAEEEGGKEGYSVYSRLNSTSVPNFLALRIRRRESQIAQMEEQSVVLKERLVCMEEEVDGLKQRVRILELSNSAAGMVGGCSCDASFA